MMVPNQSMVLYSRLHLVSQNRAILRLVRYLIIFSFIENAVSSVVLDAGWTYMPQFPSWV